MQMSGRSFYRYFDAHLLQYSLNMLLVYVLSLIHIFHLLTIFLLQSPESAEMSRSAIRWQRISRFFSTVNLKLRKHWKQMCIRDRPGDLVFQKGPEAGSDNHVGILCGKTDAGDWIAVHLSLIHIFIASLVNKAYWSGSSEREILPSCFKCIN